MGIRTLTLTRGDRAGALDMREGRVGALGMPKIGMGAQGG